MARASPWFINFKRNVARARRSMSALRNRSPFIVNQGAITKARIAANRAAAIKRRAASRARAAYSRRAVYRYR